MPSPVGAVSPTRMGVNVGRNVTLAVTLSLNVCVRIPIPGGGETVSVSVPVSDKLPLGPASTLVAATGGNSPSL